MSKVTVIGGGTGLSALIKGLKNVKEISELNAIVAVTDNGGSSGELKYSYDIPAVGDLRQVVVALSKNESTLEEVFKYRFDKKIESLHNHSLGNLIISALIDIEKDFYRGIDRLGDLFELQGNLIPITDDAKIELGADYEDGTSSVGEAIIPNKNRKIKNLKLVSKTQIVPNERAIRAIEQADFIIFGIGSLYTSIIANLIIPGVKDAIIKNSRAKKIYFANVMTQPGETDNMNLYDHLNTLEKYLGHNTIDYLIVNNLQIEKDLLDKYAKEGSYPVIIDDDVKKSHVSIFYYPLIDNAVKTIKHNDKKVCKAFSDFLKKQD